MATLGIALNPRLFRKGRGKEAKPGHVGHLLMENRNDGLVADGMLTDAIGTAERQAALAMTDRQRGRHHAIRRAGYAACQRICK